jgi:hypothetical protein
MRRAAILACRGPAPGRRVQRRSGSRAGNLAACRSHATRTRHRRAAGERAMAHAQTAEPALAEHA